MNRFAYTRAADIDYAVGEAADGRSAFVAGGTNLIDLMKENVARPERLIDISRLPLNRIEADGDGRLTLGALATNSAVARDPQVKTRYPLLAKAILAGASPQIRNMATVGGNLLQRTRCYYFYDTATPCNKREPGTGCSAAGGFNRIHAILGASEKCIAVHPSDMCVALAALDAVVRFAGKGREGAIPFAEFHRLPGETPERETRLEPGGIVTAVDLPAKGFPEHYTYLKIRDRAAYAFALVSVAAALDMEGERIREARLAVGGVAAKPWRNKGAEALLAGKRADRANFQKAAKAMVRGAKGCGANNFKIELVKRAVVCALSQAAEGGQSS